MGTCGNVDLLHLELKHDRKDWPEREIIGSGTVRQNIGAARKDCGFESHFRPNYDSWFVITIPIGLSKD